MITEDFLIWFIKYFDKDAANEIQKEYEKYIEGVLRERPS